MLKTAVQLNIFVEVVICFSGFWCFTTR